MPIFCAKRPVRIVPNSELNLDIDTGCEIEFHQRVDRLRRRVDDIEHALVSTDLELLARFLVDVRRTEHRKFLDLGGQWDRAAYSRTCALRRVDDLASRLIEHPVIIGT